METSDSEYFESADEDFEPENEVNKNKTSIKDNLPQNVSKNTNKLQISNINKNKENTEKQDSKTNIEKSIPEVAATVEDDKIKSSVCIAKDDVNKLETCEKKISQTHPCNDSNDEKDHVNDSLWNEGDGWGVDDDSDEEDRMLQNAMYSAQTSSDVNDITQMEEKASKKGNVEDNMWDTGEWENWETIHEEVSSIKREEEKKQANKTKYGIDDSNFNPNQLWKGWGSWGVTSILSTATHSVSTLTNSVSQGLSTVLESGIGAPDPEKLAMLNKTEEKMLNSAETPHSTDEECENKNLLGFGLSNIGNLVSGVSKLVESTGTKVISGGLDTLETIGKKTMEVIQDGDPGLKRKRAFLHLEGEKPVLSQVLREAKEKAEEENKSRQEKHFTRKVNYESIFDDHQGLVHLEALEMLSKQCDMKLQSLIESSSGHTLTELQETLDQVKELCELPDEEEDEQIPLADLKDRLKSAVEEIDIKITYEKLISLWEETEHWLNNLNVNICHENEIHEQAVETLAQLTAIAVEQFHKAGELLLIKDHHSTADEADSLVQLTTTLTSLIGIVAAKFSHKMNSKVTENVNKENINSLITNIFFEAANSSSYIQDAFQLLVPVLQMGAV